MRVWRWNQQSAQRLGAGRRWIIVGAIAVAACAIVGASPVAAGKQYAGACPFHSGEIRAFGTVDRSGVSGDIGASDVRATNIWIPYINSHGGILGCKLVLDLVNEGYPNVAPCVRLYRQAIASNKYDFFFGPFNSACLAVVTAYTDRAGKALIANSAADHQPFFNPKFNRLHFNAGVSTLAEGRAIARFAKSKGWKRVATLSPNFAYGQDVVKSFVDYFKQIQPGAQIVAQQWPSLGEKNLAPYVNAVLAPKPDAVVGGMLVTDILTMWKAWLAVNSKVPNLSLAALPTLELVKNANEIPPRSYTYTRVFWTIADKTPVGATLTRLYRAKYASGGHPVPTGWSYAIVSGYQMAKALIEKTHSLDPAKWANAVDTGTFGFASPYHVGLTYVNPVNQMADTCVAVGPIGFDKSLPVPATQLAKGTQKGCLHDLLGAKEAVASTTNPDASKAAVAAFYRLAKTDK